LAVFLGLVFLCVQMRELSAYQTVRLKDKAHILEVRPNQLMGFGLVVGLSGSGDSTRTFFTSKALQNLLGRMGLDLESESMKAKNVAAVMITAELPACVRAGQRLSAVVSSIGDARSLNGGTLLQSPLYGADGNVYAAAQGSLVVGGLDAAVGGMSIIKNQTTVGRLPEGVIVEAEVPVTLKNKSHLTLVLKQPDFTTAARLAKRIALQPEFVGAKAVDAATVLVPLPEFPEEGMVGFVSRLEHIEFVPDQIAKVVVNSRTGTIVIGENVRLSSVAIAHGNVSIRVEGTSPDEYQEGAVNPGNIKITENETKLVELEPAASLSSLVQALNKVGTTPRDLISILQALRASGALSAEIEVI
jgi:flagellar P-ring protein precursor FlgI